MLPEKSANLLGTITRTMDAQSSASRDEFGNRSAAEAGPPSEPRRRRHWWVWALVLLAFGLLFYWVLHHQSKTEAAGAGGGGRRSGGVVPVTIATAHAGSVGVYADAIGTVTPLNTVSI